MGRQHAGALRAQWQAAGVAADIIARQDALHAAFEARWRHKTAG